MDGWMEIALRIMNGRRNAVGGKNSKDCAIPLVIAWALEQDMRKMLR
jgi:hypothetical protein